MKSHFSRRGFLKRAALAGAVPLILPSSVWAAETAPNDKITLGFIGAGTQGRRLLDGFIGRDDTRVLAVCDCDTFRREATKKKVDAFYAPGGTPGDKGCEVYQDFRELLERKDIDAVVIATPDHWHAIIAIAAARAGKDIYCEKPMAHTIHEGRAMVNAVQANQRILQVGSMQRSSREFLTAAELVRNSAFGKITHAEVAMGGPSRPCDLPGEPLEPGLDWDMWLGPAPVRPYNSILSPRGMPDNYPDWRSYTEYAVGRVGDWGAHHYDIVQWGLGFDESGPVEVIPAPQPHAQSGARYRYATGVEVTHIPGNGITFYSGQGKLYVNRGQFKLWMGDQQKADNIGQCPQILKELLPPDAVRLYVSRNHLSDWISSVRSRKSPICNAETGQRTATVCNLVNLTYTYNQPIKWDPAKEEFTGGTGDPQWLDREYRGPWKLGAV